MNKKANKKRNRRTRYEKKHKLLTQDVQTQDVKKSKLPTVVPATTSKTHGLKLVSSTNSKDHNKGAILRFAVQNCNGLRKEGYKCRLANSMDAANIDVCCLTETHLNSVQSERWDTGHTLLTSGVSQQKRGRGSQGVGVCLSKNALLWYEAAGSRFIAINGRFCTFRLLVGALNLYFIVWYAPTSDATTADRNNNLHQLAELAEKCGPEEILFVMADANAAIGPPSDHDKVVGPFSSPHENVPGTHLRTLLAMHSLYAPVTYFPQRIEGTWIHPHYNSLYQCDHIFMKWKDRCMVKKAWNAAMLTHTDHCSLRMDVMTKKWRKPQATLRAQRAKLDFTSLFHPSKKDSTSKAVLDGMTAATTADPAASHGSAVVNNQMQALLNSVHSTISTLPKVIVPPRGWYDVNDPTTRPLVLLRNTAHELWITTGTAPAKEAYRKADKTLQAALLQAECKWWKDELAPAHQGRLPGGAARREPYAFWKQAQHALRGSSKWKPRTRAFTRNANGIQAVTITENVENICDYFSTIYNFETRPQAAAHIQRMEITPPDRSYLSPRTFEVLAAVKALKHKVPGLSGIPICVWKTLLSDTAILNIVTTFLQDCWNNEMVPAQWLKGYMLVLPKKGDPTQAKNLRLILVEESLSKIYQHILNVRLNCYHESLCPEFSNGFRPGRGTSDANFIFQTVLRKRQEHGQTSWILFLDIIKAFDTVDRHWLWKVLIRVGISPKMVSVLRTLYCDPTGELTVEGITRTMKFGGGSGQGKILAPRLFSFYLYAIFKLWMAEHPDALQSLLYQHDGKMTGRKCTEEGLPLRYCLFNLADDTALIFATKMALILHGFALIRLLRDFGLDTHLSTDANPAPKTAAMCVHPRSVLNYLRECAARHRAKETAQPTVPRTFASCPEPPLPIEIIPFDDGAYVPIVENYIYVGANVAETLLCDIEVHRKIRSASSLLGFLRPRVFGPHTTAVIVKRTVYESMVLGVLLYGSECWIKNIYIYYK